MSVLLPCPFCGSPPHKCLGDGDDAVVTCPDCWPAWKTEDEWNRRHEPPWQTEPTEEGYHWLFDYADKARGDRLVWIEKAYDHGWCIPEEGRYTHSMICQRVQKATAKPEVK